MANVGSVFSTFAVNGLAEALAGLQGVAKELDALAGRVVNVGVNGGGGGGTATGAAAATEEAAAVDADAAAQARLLVAQAAVQKSLGDYTGALQMLQEAQTLVADNELKWEQIELKIVDVQSKIEGQAYAVMEARRLAATAAEEEAAKIVAAEEAVAAAKQRELDIDQMLIDMQARRAAGTGAASNEMLAATIPFSEAQTAAINAETAAWEKQNPVILENTTAVGANSASLIKLRDDILAASTAHVDFIAKHAAVVQGLIDEGVSLEQVTADLKAYGMTQAQINEILGQTTLSTEAMAKGFISNYGATRSLRGGAMELVFALQMVSLAMGEALPKAAQEAAKGLQMVSMGAMAGFMFGGPGIAIGAITGALLALGIAATTVAPDVAALNKELDGLMVKDDAAKGLANLAGVTETQAAAALKAAKGNADYAIALNDLTRAAQAAEGPATTLETILKGVADYAGQAAQDIKNIPHDLFGAPQSHGTPAEEVKAYNDLVAHGLPAVAARAEVEKMFGAALDLTAVATQNALASNVQLTDGLTTGQAAIKASTKEFDTFTKALDNLVPHDVIIDGMVKLGVATNDEAAAAVDAAKKNSDYGDSLITLLTNLDVMAQGLKNGTVDVDAYTTAWNNAHDAIVAASDAVTTAKGAIAPDEMRTEYEKGLKAEGSASALETAKARVKALSAKTPAGTAADLPTSTATAAPPDPAKILSGLTGIDAKYFEGKPGSRDLSKELAMKGDKKGEDFGAAWAAQHQKDLMTEYNVNPEQFVGVSDEFKKQAADAKKAAGPVGAFEKAADDLVAKLDKTTSPALQDAIVKPMQAGIDKQTDVTNLYLQPIDALKTAVGDLVTYIQTQFGKLTGANTPPASPPPADGTTPPGGGGPNYSSFSSMPSYGNLRPVSSVSGAYGGEGSGSGGDIHIHINGANADPNAIASAVITRLNIEKTRYNAGQKGRY